MNKYSWKWLSHFIFITEDQLYVNKKKKAVIEVTVNCYILKSCGNIRNRCEVAKKKRATVERGSRLEMLTNQPLI